MYKAKSLLFLHAITPLHPGSGSSLGAIDLPVQRERHTNWPLIPASSLKGVLRAEMSENKLKDEIFGPDTNNAADHAGALALTDARLLFFPVRSMKGVFALATCPAVLSRLKRDLELAGIQVDLSHINSLIERQNVGKFHPDSPLMHENKAVLEDTVIENAIKPNAVKALAEMLLLPPELAVRVAVVSDDNFNHFATYCTEVTTRIKIKAETKTVEKGALFNQELLPAESFFYSVALMADSRKDKNKDGSVLMTELNKSINSKYIQVGGDETTGKGFCHLTFFNGGK